MIAKYNDSLSKRLLDLIGSLFGLVITAPLFVLISIAVVLFSGRPIFFLQKRIGKKGRVFKIIKFRTMILNASKYQNKYKHLNESDGPVFKIYDDPRFTNVGKYLSRLGLDELPQLINVLKGDMSLVGPRPLPVYEAKKLNSKYKKIREQVKPGMTSSWVINGSHKLSFKEWMQLDKMYVESSSFIRDIQIILKTIGIIFRMN